jgi:hypothetical protein
LVAGNGGHTEPNGAGRGLQGDPIAGPDKLHRNAQNIAQALASTANEWSVRDRWNGLEAEIGKLTSARLAEQAGLDQTVVNEFDDFRAQNQLLKGTIRPWLRFGRVPGPFVADA